MPAATTIFLDIAEYSRRSSAQQRSVRREMAECVRAALAHLFGLRAQAILKQSTGDGMLLVLPHESVQGWTGDELTGLVLRLHRWAHEETIRARNGVVRLRTGVHVGVIEYEEADINGNPGVVGSTVNDTKRITDAANPGQILFSEVFIREYFGEARRLRLPEGEPVAHALQGEFVGPFRVTVKHGLVLPLFRLRLAAEDLWWDNRPAKAQQQGARSLAVEFVASFLMHAVICGAWIFMLTQQSGLLDALKGQYADLLFCLKYYPHLSIYPLVFGWPVLFCLWKATRLLWSFDRHADIVGSMVLAICVALIGMHQDSVGGYMMLHEFTPTVQVRGMPPHKALYPVVSFVVEREPVEPDKNSAAVEQLQRENLSLFNYDKIWSQLQGWQGPSFR